MKFPSCWQPTIHQVGDADRDQSNSIQTARLISPEDINTWTLSGDKLYYAGMTTGRRPGYGLTRACSINRARFTRAIGFVVC